MNGMRAFTGMRSIIITAGGFQTALYSCSAAALFAMAYAIGNRKPVGTVAVYLLLAFAAGTLVSSIEVIPGFEPVRNSIGAN